MKLCLYMSNIPHCNSSIPHCNSNNSNIPLLLVQRQVRTFRLQIIEKTITNILLVYGHGRKITGKIQVIENNNVDRLNKEYCKSNTINKQQSEHCLIILLPRLIMDIQKVRA